MPFAGPTANAAKSPCREELAAAYTRVRNFSEQLCAPLATEDYVVQSMPDCSPTKWHLAHTSWFFETFILQTENTGYCSPHPQYGFLFNSYYNAIGERHSRAQRGLLSRPTVAEVYAYRHYVDEAMKVLICGSDAENLARISPLITLGINHEQQHQELIVTDFKHMFAASPLQTAYQNSQPPQPLAAASTHHFSSFEEGMYSIGYEGNGFSFDNEGPQHRVWLDNFALGSRLITCGEYRDFVEDGGYRRPELWLSDGWACAVKNSWEAPLYWGCKDGSKQIFTLSGVIEPVWQQPVCHLSYYEADAFARWRAKDEPGVRLPTEAEWETVARQSTVHGSFAESGRFHPEPAACSDSGTEPAQLFGELWQWTQSPYTAYPRYVPARGALGEYNGKFMCNQFVLRGGSCATPRTHIRPTYRNFFGPESRWQFSGIRLAKDI
jgi:ergothioneine biosynthesis protein EgtB